MKIALAASLLIFVASTVTLGKEGRTMSGRTYQAGQVWAYKTRPTESKSRLYICKVDADAKLGAIYHIYIDKVAIKNPYIAGGIQDALPHAPVLNATLDASVTQLVSEKASHLPDIAEGHRTWKEAYDKGHAGAFTIPVSDIIKYIEQAASAQR